MGDRRRIGDIHLFAELAQGPTTVVYKGYQKEQDRFVLLKTLRPVVGYNEELVRRFEEEARLIAQVDHPNVVTIYAHGQTEGQTYLATEFVDGIDLRGLLERGSVPPKIAAYVLLEAARGLQAAHANGILHRDLKPSNILISHDGHVKLTDFGMASLVEDEDLEVRGTPGYLAPEQVRGEPPARASDLFSLGATCYEMLSGRPAFAGSDTGALLDAVLHHDPLPRLDRYADVPAPLQQICARLLAKTPADRYADTSSLIADLEAFQGIAPAHAVTLRSYLEDPSAFRRAEAAVLARTTAAASNREPAPSPPQTRRHAARYAMALLLALVVAGFAWTFWDDAETTSTTMLPTDPLRQQSADGPSSRVASTDSSDLTIATDSNAVDASTAFEIPTPTDQPEAIPKAILPEPKDITMQRATADSIALQERPSVVADSRPGQLTIDVRPWADVVINDESIGKTPIQHEVPPGTHRVMLKNEAFPTHQTEITVRPGEAQTLNVSLWDKVGRVQLRVGPWADVYVDDAFWDTVPPQDRPLIVAPGTHRLQLRHRELGTLDTTFTIQAGQERLLQFNLTTLLPR